ncbi:hypothetical protein GR211_21950 [Rhizobium leguminosarum]|uniref:hypothetical protein n=1 Tax=Rhizobium ruizarguesonis TaxID=2081791 RepID=UPI0013BB26C9|nr:hypothetical protein [Rhizobium ruizarguesonis]NEJ15483.1 hypothetical protein [Rhizobium ruizarguesonis]NEK29558.1 hypothetical protein [Rhizobium ruizarguesonis]
MSDRMREMAAQAAANVSGNENKVREEFRELIAHIGDNFTNTLRNVPGGQPYGAKLTSIDYAVRDNVNIICLMISDSAYGHTETSAWVQFGRDYTTGKYSFWTKSNPRKFYKNRSEVEMLVLQYLKTRNFL